MIDISTRGGGRVHLRRRLLVHIDLKMEKVAGNKEHVLLDARSCPGKHEATGVDPVGSRVPTTCPVIDRLKHTHKKKATVSCLWGGVEGLPPASASDSHTLHPIT